MKMSKGSMLKAALCTFVMSIMACEKNRSFDSGEQNRALDQTPQVPQNYNQKPQQSELDPRSMGQNQQPLPPPIATPQPYYIPPVLPPIVIPPVQPPLSQPRVNPQPQQPDLNPPQNNQNQGQTQPNTPFQPFIPEGPKYESGSLRFPITPVANMEKGFQATNPGFRAVLKNSAGQIIAAGPMTVEAAINGEKTPSAPGNAYPRLVMNLELKYRSGHATSGSGTLKICLAEDPMTPMDQDIQCKQTGCYDHDRPCGYTGRPVDFTVQGDTIEITRWGQSGVGVQGFQLSGSDADSPTQAALSAYHAAKDSPFVPTAAWEEAQSPLVFDLNRDGKLDLMSFHDRKVAFDLNGDGQQTITGWVGATDGLLCLDIDGNGKIDSGRELFGEFSYSITTKTRGQTFSDGFTALAQYDDNLDQRIDAQDKIFSQLRIWQDKNSNGLTDKGELLTLSEAGITSISLFYEKAADENFAQMNRDNDMRLLGEYTAKDGKTYRVVDVWFRYDFTSSVVSH